MFFKYLNFSDGAKYADIARSIVFEKKFATLFNFWNADNITAIKPFTPYSIAFFFNIFEVNDLSVIATSLTYFFFSLIFVYLLTNKIYENKVVSILSSIAVGFNHELINYATNGSSESPFIFELLAAMYFFSFNRVWGYILGTGFMILMYLTRQQAIIYIFGLILYLFVKKYNWRKGVSYSILSLAVGSVLYIFLFNEAGVFAVTQNLPGVAVSDSLRGSVVSINFISLYKKLFYNLYNFYKALPSIASPYMWGLFVIGLFIWGKDKLLNSFKISVAFMVALTFLVTALTIPFYRYLHPVAPLVYIVATITLYQILSKFIKNKKYLYLSSAFLILFFVVGQTLGALILDSRFKNKLVNNGKPPVYVLLSYKLKDLTNEDDVVLTNLDTWGSWYGERKTVWYPLRPSMIIDPDTGEIPFDDIYLTSYKKDDENYYMGEEWRLIYDNPDDEKAWKCEGCDVISEEFDLKSVVNIPADKTYEKEEGIGILLEKVK